MVYFLVRSGCRTSASDLFRLERNLIRWCAFKQRICAGFRLRLYGHFLALFPRTNRLLSSRQAWRTRSRITVFVWEFAVDTCKTPIDTCKWVSTENQQPAILQSDWPIARDCGLSHFKQCVCIRVPLTLGPKKKCCNLTSKVVMSPFSYLLGTSFHFILVIKILC